MTDSVPVVDLFSGGGGLTEGFASLRDSRGKPRFNIALSVEDEIAAHKTLRLRSFLRKFSSGFPLEYYDFLNGTSVQEPDWKSLYPNEWQEACNEVLLLTLGTPEAKISVRNRIIDIRSEYGEKSVLLGGPPCQSYSVAGRARNAGNSLYDPAKDIRQSLYLEFVEILKQLQPAVAVMENVRGMISATQNGKSIFSNLMLALANAGGKNRYQLYPLASSHEGHLWKREMNPKEFIVHAENHGIPQRRHRIFIICIRHDIATKTSGDILPRLGSSETRVTVSDMIGMMPRLRSRLSRNDDSDSWKRALDSAYKLVSHHMPGMPSEQEQKFRSELNFVAEATTGTPLPWREVRGKTNLPDTCPPALRNWILDRKVTRLPNNETRGHTREDIARYLYAAVYAKALGRSPRACDFPEALAAKHRNWNTGNFDDRFRVQVGDQPSTTITSHISKDGHYFIHPDPTQCRSLTVREAARLQTFPDNYFFKGNRTQQYVQVGNAVPPYLALQIAEKIWNLLEQHDHTHSQKEVHPRADSTQLKGAKSASLKA